jgi:Uma2 family endonuclease
MCPPFQDDNSLMIVSVNSIVKYPDTDDKPIAEGDVQRKCLAYCTEALSLHYQSRQDVYVAGNLFIYYEQGNPASVVAPDVFVIFGANANSRKSYKVWEESDLVPNFILEITSYSTRAQDQGAKKGIYAYLGVQEYFLYDPTDDYLRPALQGFRLTDGNYLPIQRSSIEENSLSLHSQILNLDLRIIEDKFRFYHPNSDRMLPSHAELSLALESEVSTRQALESKLIELEAKLKDLQRD